MRSMRSMRSRVILLVAAGIAVFSLVAFAAPFESSGAFWAAYGFGLAAIVSQLYFLQSALKPGTSARSKVYGYPIARVGAIYLVAQMVVSIAEMAAASWVPLWAALILNAVLTVFGLAGCVGVELARDETIAQDARRQDRTEVMGRLRMEASNLAARYGNSPAASALTRLSDELRFSDPVSNELTRPFEESLLSELANLRQALAVNDAGKAAKIADNALWTVRERSAACCAGKQSTREMALGRDSGN